MSAEFDEAWDLFASDGQDALAQCEASVLALEEGVEPDEVNRLYRAMHTLKGNARVMGLELMERLAHHAEDLVGLVRDQGHDVDESFFELLLASLDVLRAMMETATDAQGDVEDDRRLPLIERLKAYHELHAKPEELTASMRAMPSQHPGDIFLWSMSPSVPPEVRISIRGEDSAAPPVASSPPPPHDDVDPQQDDEFVAIFLELAVDQLGQLEEGLARLEAEPGDDAARERATITVDSLRLAAERMGYRRLEEGLARLEAQLRAGGSDDVAARASLAEVRREVAAVEGAAIEGAGASRGVTPTDAGALNREFHAERMAERLGDLREATATLAAQMAAGRFAGDAIHRAADAAATALGATYHALQCYGLDEAAQAALVLSDFAARVATAEEGLSKSFVRRLEQTVGALEQVVGADDDRPVTRAVVQELVTAAAGLGVGAELGAEARRILAAVPSSMRRFINEKQLVQIKESVETLRYVYELRMFMGQDEELAAQLFTWMQSHVTTIASAVRDVDGEPRTDMLVVSDDDLPTLLDSLRAWDPDEKVELDPWSVDVPRMSMVPGVSSAPEARLSIVPAAPKAPAEAPGSQVIGLSTAPPPAPSAPAAPSASAAPSAPAEKPPPTPASKPEAKPSPKAKPKKAKEGDGLIRLQSSKVDQLMSLAGEINLSVGAVLCHPELEGLDLDGFQTAAHRLEMLIRELQDAAAGLGLTPVLGVFGRMRRLVRDLARQTGKQIDLLIEDNETEIDRALVDSIYEPLMHIIRNAADHGLESPEARVEAGKPAQGTIRLIAAQQGGHILIRVEDDGKGLDTERIVARARERGLVGPDEEVAEEQAWQLIFAPGFSTAASVSNLSGRGVGMDVVATTLEQLNGRVMVESFPGRGTRVDLHLPLTLAFAEVIVVEVDGRLYVVPMSAVSSIFRPEEGQLSDVSADGGTVVRVLDELIPVRWLARYFHERGDQSASEVGDRVIVAVQTTRGKVAIPIDRIHGAERVTMKSLPEPMRSIRAAAGCGVLRSGEVAIALDCERLIHERAA